VNLVHHLTGAISDFGDLAVEGGSSRDGGAGAWMFELRGILTDIWQEEASETDEASDVQLSLRLRGLAPVPLQRVISFNPISDQHWLKRVYHDNPQPGVRIVKTTYQHNRFLDDKYRRELEGLRERDPLSYQVYTLGEWGQAGNLVFRSIVYESCRKKPEEYDEVYVGIDFGYNHYTALEFVGVKDEELYSFRELYVREHTIPDIIRMIDSLQLLPRTMVVTADSAEPKSIDEMRRAGFRVEAAKKGPDSVIAQLRFLNSRRWHIDPVACPGLTSETRSYSWKKDRYGNILDDEPVAYHDDAIAGVRYAIERLVSPKAKFYALGFEG
jgi:phage terminase large subunit